MKMKMKKTAYLWLLIFFAAATSNARGIPNNDVAIESPQKRFSVTLNAGIRTISENIYEQLFGKGNLVYGLDLGYRWGKSLEVFIHTDYLSVKGETTLTKEETALSIIPIELGIRFLLGKHKLRPYLGAGCGYYNYKDEMKIEDNTYTIKEGQFGFFMEGGMRFYFTGSLFVNLKGKYISLKVKPDTAATGPDEFLYAEDRNLGGMAFMGGIGISF